MPWGLAAVSAGAAVGLSVAGTLFPRAAVTTTVTPASVDLGHIRLNLDDGSSLVRSSEMSFPPMRPGDTVAEVLVVGNDGIAPIHYFVESEPADIDGLGLGAALIVKVTGDAATSGSGRSQICAGAPLPHSDERFTTRLLGSNRAARLLPPGEMDTLCVQAHLWEGAPSSLQSAASNVTFKVRVAQ